MKPVIVERDLPRYERARAKLEAAVEALFDAFEVDPKRFLRGDIQHYDFNYEAVFPLLIKPVRELTSEEFYRIYRIFAYYEADSRKWREGSLHCLRRILADWSGEPPYAARDLMPTDLEPIAEGPGRSFDPYWKNENFMRSEHSPFMDSFVHYLELPKAIRDAGWPKWPSAFIEAFYQWAWAWFEAAICYPASAGEDFIVLPTRRDAGSVLYFLADIDYQVGPALHMWHNIGGLSAVRALICWINYEYPYVRRYQRLPLSETVSPENRALIHDWLRSEKPLEVLQKCPADAYEVYLDLIAVTEQQLGLIREWLQPA